LAATLGDGVLQERILEIEKNGGDLLKNYYELDTDTVKAVRGILWDRHRKGAVVTWLVKETSNAGWSVITQLFVLGRKRSRYPRRAQRRGVC
jgi:hypothetical protein